MGVADFPLAAADDTEAFPLTWQGFNLWRQGDQCEVLYYTRQSEINALLALTNSCKCSKSRSYPICIQ